VVHGPEHARRLSQHRNTDGTTLGDHAVTLPAAATFGKRTASRLRLVRSNASRATRG
jgi:hypothetical protein